MKKIITILAIISTITIQAQDYLILSAGFDPKLAVSGAYDYDKTPVLDAQIKFGTRLSNGIEVGLQFEYADLKPYYFSYGVFTNYVIPNNKKTIMYSLGIEGIVIDRGYNKSMQEQAMDNVITYGLNAEVRFRIVENFLIGAILNETHRNDLKYMYNEKQYFHTSGFIRFIYEVEQK